MPADGGFNISDDIAIYGPTLAISSFTKNKSQLGQEVDHLRFSQVRSH